MSGNTSKNTSVQMIYSWINTTHGTRCKPSTCPCYQFHLVLIKCCFWLVNNWSSTSNVVHLIINWDEPTESLVVHLAVIPRLPFYILQGSLSLLLHYTALKQHSCILVQVWGHLYSSHHFDHLLNVATVLLPKEINKQSWLFTSKFLKEEYIKQAVES